MNKVFALLFVAVGIICLVYAFSRGGKTESPAAGLAIGTKLADFSLTERNGKPFHASQLEGKVWVASFFFSACPTSCVKQNEIVASLQDEFGEQGVRFVSISCDPQTDTPDRLTEYAGKFHAHPQQWYFLTGDLTYIRQVGRDAFKLPVDKRTHADRLVLIDKWGNLRRSYNWKEQRELDALRKEITRLMAEDQPPQSQAEEPVKPVEPDPQTGAYPEG